ncbi:class I SAM-dependent methyltransferase [Streptococcus sp. S784/96/1]|uniref:class I SAM-dependent methyltransferase n=1 Tax=Streptococcus sp. S784/96/1 TaxID=2653499 RepID=UPI001386900A|nr:class I SAM-dependent methyltransferase [Streptococcus sp. S784/96/1]
MASKEQLTSQYQKSDNLNIRIDIHRCYSTNKYGFNNWIFDQYEFQEGEQILDLGCGTSIMWKDNFHKLPKHYELTLVDFSEGMIEASRSNLPKQDNINYVVSDLTELPFEDHSFDVISANMVLFHLENLQDGLKEIKRVLKPNGRLLTATFGENGLSQTLGKWIEAIGKTNDTPNSFTLQNGEQSLKNFFSQVEQRNYIDSLEVTVINDIVDYLYSLPEVFELESHQRQQVAETLVKQMQNGKLIIPKEYGLFICKN